MNPIHFESDPADIRINLEIRLQIPDQIMALSESALSGCSCLSLQLCVSVWSVATRPLSVQTPLLSSGWLRGTAIERWSLTSQLSLSCA